MKNLFVVLALLSSYTFVYGQVKTFNLLGAEWHNPNAWTPAGVPTANDSVLILGICAIKVDSTARAKYVFIESSFGRLEIQRDIPSNKRGVLIINDAPGNGFVNEGIFINGGRLTIRRTTDTAVVNRGYFENLDLAKVVIDSTVNYDGIYNEHKFTNSGLIDISRIEINGLSNNDTIVNNALGEIVIDGTGSNGIFNNENAQFNNHGYLSIANSQYGLLNNGELINLDTIEIDSSSIGLFNNEKFLNTVEALVIISNSSLYGVFNLDLTASQITNNGKIDIISSGGAGVASSGEIFNYDSLIIQGSGHGILNQKTFINDLTGVVIIKQIYGTGIVNDRNDLTASQITNNGKIDIMSSGSYGVRNEGEIFNYDSLVIQGSSLGIWNEETFINDSTGVVIIKQISSTGIYNASTFENKHKIVIRNVSAFGIYNFDAFINHDSILITKTDGNGLLNYGNFQNRDGAYISIHDLTGLSTDGIYNVESLINQGTIDIKNIPGRGIYTSNYLINEPAGFISISDLIGVNAIGIENVEQGDTVKNYGLVQLENLEEYGIINRGFFGNFDSLLISDIGNIGLNNLDTFFNSSTGYVEIQDGPNYILQFGLFNSLDARILNQGAYWLTDVLFGMTNLGRIDNMELMQVNGVSVGLLNGSEDGIGEFNNSGNLLFENLIAGVVNQAALYNSLTGHISISNYTNNPFESVLGSTFDCLGTLDIGTIDVH